MSGSNHQPDPSQNTEAFSDHDAHLRALQSLDSCLADWNAGYANRADEAIDAEMEGEPLIELVRPAFADTCFANVAQSLAFVTTTAAFVESFFKERLPVLGKKFTGRYQHGHARFQRYGQSVASFWDSTKPIRKGDGAATTICEILEGADLMRFMVPNFTSIIHAIFKYRNQMIHHGFEWGLAERRKFARTIGDESWRHWFFVSETDGEPWFFTVTPTFRGDCLNLCARSVHAFNGLIRDGRVSAIRWTVTDHTLESDRFNSPQ